MGSVDMPRALRDKLKQKSDNSNVPAMLRNFSPSTNEPVPKEKNEEPVASTPVIESTPPPLRRFVDIFSADNLLDRDIASSSAITLASTNNRPAPALSLTGFNQQQASKNSLTPSFDDANKAKAHSVKHDPDALRDYRKKRIKELDDSINSLNTKRVVDISPNDILGAGGSSLQLGEVQDEATLAAQVDEQKKYKDELQKSIAETAAVAVPKSFYDKGQTPNVEEVGRKFLETVGYGAIGDDERVLKQLKEARLDEDEKSIAELTSQTIRNRLHKEGAAALSAYHVAQAEEVQSANPDRIAAYTSLVNSLKSTSDLASRSLIQSKIDAVLEDPIIKTFADNASAALKYADDSKTSSRLFPQVQREEKRQQLNDIYFALETKKNEERSGSLNPLSKIRVALSAILGEDPSEEDIKKLASEAGLPEEDVRGIVNDGKEGFFGKSRKGVRVSGALAGISQAADETLANSIMGLRRIFDTDNVDVKNALLSTKSSSYNLGAAQNSIYDKAGQLNLNPFSIFNTAGRGVGQMAVFAAPTLVTGGFVEGLLAPELKAAATAGKGISGASASVKAAEVLATHAAGYVGSYEPAYKEIAAYTDDEDIRRAYANVVAHANAGAEHLMSPADIAKRVGLGSVGKERLIKTFIKDAEKFGVQETAAKRLGQAGLNMLEVAGAENIEEQATNLVTNAADAKYMGKTRTASELADQFWQTAVTTTVNMLPMMVGAGMSGMNDMSNIKKEGLFEVGNEPDAIKERLKNLFDNNELTQEQYNTRASIVNTMQGIVGKVNGITKSDGSPLSYDEKVAVAAQQFRIDHNNRIKGNGAIEAQATQADADNKQAIAEQQAIINDTPLYKVSGEIVSRKEASDAIEAGNIDLVEIKNDEELKAALVAKRLQENAHKENNEVKEPTLQDVLDTKVIYNGMTGTLVRDGMQYVFQQEESNREYVIEPSDNYESVPVADLGIHPLEEIVPEVVVDNSARNADAIQAKISVGEPLTPEEEKNKKLYELSGRVFEPQKVSEVSLNDDNSFTIRGENYVNKYSDPFQAINRDENGNVISVNLDTEDGGKRTFRGTVANDIAYQMTLKEITKDNVTRDEFEQFINADEQSAAEITAAIDNGSGIKATEGAAVADNGSVPSVETAEATVGDAGATATVGDQSGGSDQQSSGQQQSREPAGTTPVVDVYENDDTLKQAFNNLSPENKVRFGELMADGNIDEADALLTANNMTSETTDGAANSGVSIVDKDGIGSIKTTPFQQSLIKRAKVIYSALVKLIPNIEIYVHPDQASMVNALKAFGLNTPPSQANFTFGSIDGKSIRRIDVDLSSAKLGSIAHEATHAVLQHIFGDSPSTFKSFKDRLQKIVEKSTNEYLDNFVKNYNDEDIRPEEYLAELGAVIATNDDKAIDPPIIHRIKKLINLVTSKALGKSISPETESTEAIRDFFVSMNRAFKTGNLNADELITKANKVKGATKPKSTKAVKTKQSLLFNEDGNIKFKDKGSSVGIEELVSDVNHPVFKPLYNWFVTKYKGDKKIHIFGGRVASEGVAFADNKNKFLAINKNHPSIDDLKDQDYLDKVVAHEIIHAIIYDSIGANKRVLDGFNSDLKELVSILNDQDTSKLDQSVQDTIGFINKGNPEELVAYALTDTKLAQYLDTISVQRNGQRSTSVWGKIKDLIAGILFGKPKSLLDAVVDALDSYVGDFRNNSIFYRPDARVGELVERYVSGRGETYNPPIRISKLDTDKSNRIADEYEAMKHDPANPEVVAAYTAMTNETVDQYKLVSGQYKIEVYTKEGEPYRNSKDMVDDLINNNHLYIFATESGFGEGKITDEQRAENPLLAATEFKDANGVPLLVNDLFRAVHDIIGHGELGNSFGAVGEENAWMAHSRMYSPLARRAMTSETRGQNSWVNFSGSNVAATAKISEGNRLIAEGKKEEGERLKKEGQNEFRFADQKIGLLPTWVSEDADTIQSRQSLTPLTFEQRKKRLDSARSIGALTEEQYQKALDKALTLTGTERVDALTSEEQAQYDNFFKKNARAVSLRERVANIAIPDTDIDTPYAANETFANAGFDKKGRPAQGNTTTIALMLQANIDFINELLSENPNAIHDLVNYLGFNENRGKLARDFNMEGVKTLNDYRLANSLFLYINKGYMSELGLSPEQVKSYSNYLQKFSSELGREMGQSLNTAKIRKMGDALVDDMILEGTLSASEYNAISEAEDAIVDILSGDGKMSDEELLAAEDLLFDTELEKEKQAKQSTLLSKLLGLKVKEEKLGAAIPEAKSQKIVDRINKQMSKTQQDIKDVLNKIKCD